ncbi:MAG: ABC transporter permease [Actinomycetota bacterium]|nr:ABC transporter permease [Actinomycetota bacterium]
MSQAVAARPGADDDDADRRLGPLRPPNDVTGLFGVFRRRYLLGLLVRKELRVRYQGSLLGLAWSYVKPLIRFLTYVVVIGYVIGLKDLEKYPYHVFCAMMVVTLFSETLVAGTRSVVKNKSLVNKMNVPREMFPVASMLVTIYHMGPQYLILFIACLLAGWTFSFTALAAALLSFALVVTFSLAVALACSALNVWYRDFQNFVETISHLIMWSVPMIYPFSRVVSLTEGNWIEQVYLTNPIAEAVLLAQTAFWVPVLDDRSVAVMPDHLFVRGLVMLVVCLGLVALAQRLFKRLEGKFPEHM